MAGTPSRSPCRRTRRTPPAPVLSEDLVGAWTSSSQRRARLKRFAQTHSPPAELHLLTPWRRPQRQEKAETIADNFNRRLSSRKLVRRRSLLVIFCRYSVSLAVCAGLLRPAGCHLTFFARPQWSVTPNGRPAKVRLCGEKVSQRAIQSASVAAHDALKNR